MVKIAGTSVETVTGTVLAMTRLENVLRLMEYDAIRDTQAIVV